MNQTPQSSTTGKKKAGRPLKFNPAGLDWSSSQRSGGNIFANFQLPHGRGTSPMVGLTSSSPSTYSPISRRKMSSAAQRGGPGMLQHATEGLLEVFSGCNSLFGFDKGLNPRRVLTKPSRPAFNSGFDNEKHDYILYVNDVIGSEEGRKYYGLYVILDLLGQGTFGQVVKCQSVKNGEIVAVKVIKNQPAYFNQSMMEVTVLELLNGRHDPQDRHHIVRMRDTFVFRQHLCVVVELLSLNLYELIKQNQYRGFSLQLCRVFLAQILDALRVLKEAKIVHCDLKPENILLKSLDSPGIKVIDYGSACHEQQTLYSYIQSRFYRSPEVLLGLPYTAAIDMWSLGCIAAELFLGLPIFPGASGYDQVSRIVETLGVPPVHMLELGRDSALYFDKRASPDGRGPKYFLKSRERYALETGKQEAPSKKYFSTSNLEDMILGYAVRPKDMSPTEKEAEMRQRRLFIDFLRGLLKLNPVERWNPQQALQHPFITGHQAIPPTPSAAAAMARPVVLPGAASAAPSQAIATRQRPRANTLSSLSLQDVPPQIQKIATVSKGQPGVAPKTAARQPPAEVPAPDVEPPALPFEVGSVKNNMVMPTVATLGTTAAAPATSIGKTRGKSGYYVDRLANYASGRRVSNPPGMMNMQRGGAMSSGGARRMNSRSDSLGMDEFAPSSLPSSLPHHYQPSPPMMEEPLVQQQQTRRVSASRRASEPSVAGLNLNGGSAAQPIKRKGSYAAASPNAPSSLSRSLTMSDVQGIAAAIRVDSTAGEADTEDLFDAMDTTPGPSNTSSSSASSASLNNPLSQHSSSSFMDTLEEVTDEEDQLHHHNHRMDID